MPSVAGIAVRDSKVFVARRMPGGQIGGRWEFPGGKLEAGETAPQAARREFMEEFALDVAAGRILGSRRVECGGRSLELIAVLVDFDGEPLALAEHEGYLWADAESLTSLDLAESDRGILDLVLPLLP